MSNLRHPTGVQVGARSAPLGPNDTHTVAGRGQSGDCNIPTDAVGLVLNVTSTGATLPTFLTIYPTDANPRPETSNLNPQPGQPPTPNAVTTDLSASGEFSIYNKQGSVYVFADVVGYYTDHNHDDRYFPRDDQAGRVVATGFYSVTLQELSTAESVSITSQAGAVGIVTLTVTGVDTALIPVIHVTPFSGTPRICMTSLLQSVSATEFNFRVACFDTDGDPLAAQFSFSIID